MKTIFKVLAAALALSSFLGGCAVYQPVPLYSQGPYGQPGPVYEQSAPVYVQPAPVYVGPPVSFGFNFGYWGGGRRGWGGRHYR
jgi:hypothetical protein